MTCCCAKVYHMRALDRSLSIYLEKNAQTAQMMVCCCVGRLQPLRRCSNVYKMPRDASIDLTASGGSAFRKRVMVNSVSSTPRNRLFLTIFGLIAVSVLLTSVPQREMLQEQTGRAALASRSGLQRQSGSSGSLMSPGAQGAEPPSPETSAPTPLPPPQCGTSSDAIQTDCLP